MQPNGYRVGTTAYSTLFDLSCQTSTFFKISFRCTLSISVVQKTKDKPRMKKCLGWHFECCARRVPTLRKSAAHRIKIRIPHYKKCVSLRLPFLFRLLYLALLCRENTERRPRELRINSSWQKVHFLNIAFLKRLTESLKKLTLFLKKLTPILK